MQIALLGSVLLMGFLGSWHCGVMCGPLSCSFKKNNDFLTYHLGRLVSYVILGLLLFYGTHFFINTESRGLKMLASVVFGLLYIFFGLIQLDIFRGHRYLFKFYKIQFIVIEKNKKIAQKFPIVLGLLTGLFPCGWLYSFLLLAAQMTSAFQATLVIFIFWLTALPAFMVFNGFMKNLIKNSPLRYQTISGIVLILAGVFSIIGHWSDILAGALF